MNFCPGDFDQHSAVVRTDLAVLVTAAAVGLLIITTHVHASTHAHVKKLQQTDTLPAFVRGL